MEERFKHTKGKWNKRGNKIFVGDGYNSICTVHIQNSWDKNNRPIEDVEANANSALIEKAPELLEAVVNLQKRLESLIHLTPSGIERNVMCDEMIITMNLIDSCATCSTFKKVIN